MVKIAFYRGKNRWYSGLIRWWTRGPYSHTEVIVRSNGESHLCYSADLPDKGVRGKWRVLDVADWDIIEIDADPIAVEKWYLDREHCGYDILGLIGFVLRPVGQKQDKYFCSEANAASLGIKEAWRFDPNSFKPIIDHLSSYKRK
jgi:hypothetical protein